MSLEWSQTKYVPKRTLVSPYKPTYSKPVQPPGFPIPFTQLLRPKTLEAPSVPLFPPHLPSNALVRSVFSVFRIYLELDCLSPPPSLPYKPKTPSSPAWTSGFLASPLASHTDRPAQQPKWSLKNKKHMWFSYSKPSHSLSSLSE